MSVKYDAVENFNLSKNFKYIVDRGRPGGGFLGCCNGKGK